MSTDPDSTPHLGKRRHLSGGSSGPSSPRQTNAAGTAPTKKKQKLDDGKVTMDVDFEAKDASRSTPTFDGPYSMETIPVSAAISSEIQGNAKSPTTESPRSITPPRAEGASSIARAESSTLHSYPLSEQKSLTGDSLKTVARERAISTRGGGDPDVTDIKHGTSASELYQKIVQDHHRLVQEGNLPGPPTPFDPLKSWFDRLGLPCHPATVKQISKRKLRQEALADANASISVTVEWQHSPELAELPLLDEDDSLLNSEGAPKVWESIKEEGEGEEDEDEEDEDELAPPTVAADSAKDKPKEKNYNASSLDQGTLSKHCQWAFIPWEEGLRGKPSARSAYKPEYRYHVNRSDYPTLDIEERPKRVFTDGRGWILDRYLHNHLSYEQFRMLDKDQCLPQFLLPEEWKEEDGAAAPVRYQIPEDYKKAAGMKRRKRQKIPQKRRLCPTSEGEESQTEARVVIPKHTLQSIAANEEVVSLREKFPLVGKAEEIRNAAITLCQILTGKNLLVAKYHARRACLQTISTFPELEPYIVWQTREAIQIADHDGFSGDVTGLEDAQYIYGYPPKIISRYMNYFGDGKKAKSELHVEKTVGSLLRDVVTGNGLEVFEYVLADEAQNQFPKLDYSGKSMNFPTHLRPVGSTPQPDLFVRATADINWPESMKSLYPVVFAGEAKRGRKIRVEALRAQLATAFHATLIILILYYLDTRENASSVIPPWMFLYGINYTEFSITITAHHPYYAFDDKGPGGHWELRSTILTNDYDDVFRFDDPIRRFCFLAVLFRIRSHSLLVLKQLRSWKRAEIVLSPLLLGTTKPYSKKGI